MSLLNIIKFPDSRLKLSAKKINYISETTKKQINSMIETMYKNKGIGLAATQINIQKQIIILDIDNKKIKPLCLINPKIINKKNEIFSQEGCLSFPDIYLKIKRSKKCKVKYTNLKEKIKTINSEKILSICLQHEIDHLNGITIFDHISKFKQKIIIKKLRKKI